MMKGRAYLYIFYIEASTFTRKFYFTNNKTRVFYNEYEKSLTVVKV